MFFDDPKTDTTYNYLLSQIAKTQRKLLSYHFDWNTRTPIIPQKRGLFSRKKQADPAYTLLLEQLEKYKQQVVAHRRQEGYSNGIFWWNLPWEEVESYLIYDLSQEDDAGSWRFERHYECIEQEETYFLFLKEEGHYSDFSSRTSYETSILSQYSQSEIDSKMRDFRNMQNNFNATSIFFSGDNPVYSPNSGQVYRSQADYILSSEHWFRQEFDRDQYKKTLYTEKETYSVSVQSNSKHYKALFQIAAFQLNRGLELQMLDIKNYELMQSFGDVPSELAYAYGSKDAAVNCAAFLSGWESVRHVPLSLFGSDVKGGAANFQDAMRQAELFTCLANKID